MTMNLIQHIELGSTQALIEFSSIPQTFTDLYLLVSARIDGSAFAYAFDDGKLLINGSITSNYKNLFGEGSGSGISDTWSDNNRFAYNNSTSTANTFGNIAIYFPNYAGSTSKSISVDGVTENNATLARQIISAGLVSSTAAITSLALDGSYGNFVAGSSATLYGITKGSDGTTTVS